MEFHKISKSRKLISSSFTDQTPLMVYLLFIWPRNILADGSRCVTRVHTNQLLYLRIIWVVCMLCNIWYCYTVVRDISLVFSQSLFCMIWSIVYISFVQVKWSHTFTLLKDLPTKHMAQSSTLFTRLILCLHHANERRRYKATPSIIGWAQT